MQVLQNRQELLSWSDARQSVGFVPTMGNLHAGHLSLIEKIRPHCTKILVSIYVNPAQFSPSEDYASYPRTLEEDIDKLSQLNIDAVFVPSNEDIYTDGLSITASKEDVLAQYPNIALKAKRLCGLSRPHFFFGVIYVVKHLFKLVQPNVVCLGEKDFQQYQIIKEFCQHQFPQITIISAPTKRESNGLAMSSRNVYLDEAQYLIAPKLWQQMQDCQQHLLQAQVSNFASILVDARTQLEQSGFEVEYFELCKENSFLATTDLSQARLFLAVYLQNVVQKIRLIDNLKI